MWKWLAAIGASLIAALQIVTLQRNKARQAAKEAQYQVEAQAAIREAEQRIAKAQANARNEANQVQYEIESNKGNRPDTDFGDSRLHQRKD